jgi:uncharacterized membrane protein YcaP (DUF421 family)
MYLSVNVFFRSIFSILILFLIARIMGKKQISQLNYFDYIVGITIGSIAGQYSIDKNLSQLSILISLGTWGVFPIALSYITLKSIWLRRILEGTSTILIKDGVILEKNLRKERYHINDLLEELRKSGAFNVSEVAYAILETNGQISVLLKSEKHVVTCQDLNISNKPQALSINLIVDEKIMNHHLDYLGLDEKWLLDELGKQNLTSAKNILLAVYDNRKQLHIYFKNNFKDDKLID